MERMEIRTADREDLVDITSRVRQMVADRGWKTGALLLYCPHTTGAVTVNEGADPSVVRDIVVNLRKLVPRRGDYKHMEGNSDAHIKTSLFSPDQLLVVQDGEVMLGTWQKVFFCEFDGPRTRNLWMQWLPGQGD